MKSTSRHAFRAKWHEYNEGVFFVTICCHAKKHLFGFISDDEMHLSLIGMSAEDCLADIPKHFPDVELYNYIIMPNHVHFILDIKSHGENNGKKDEKLGCLKSPMHGEECQDFHHNSRLATIVGCSKAAVSRKSKCLTHDNTLIVWQRLYHEHIIRSEISYNLIMNYIDENVSRWDKDCFNR